MNKLVSLAILAGGVILVVYGVAASKSFSSDVSNFFTGSPTDKTIWLLLLLSGWQVCGVVNLRDCKC
jgi:hypothetical protein